MEQVSLKEYFDTQVENVKEAAKLALATLDKRLDGMNEWRGESKDRQETYLTKEAYESKHQTLQNQVDELRLSKANLEGKASQSSVMIALLISIIGVILAVFNTLRGIIK